MRKTANNQTSMRNYVAGKCDGTARAKRDAASIRNGETMIRNRGKLLNNDGESVSKPSL